jgi:hypothetical protein
VHRRISNLQSKKQKVKSKKAKSGNKKCPNVAELGINICGSLSLPHAKVAVSRKVAKDAKKIKTERRINQAKPANGPLRTAK